MLSSNAPAGQGTVLVWTSPIPMDNSVQLPTDADRRLLPPDFWGKQMTVAEDLDGGGADDLLLGGWRQQSVFVYFGEELF